MCLLLMLCVVFDIRILDLGWRVSADVSGVIRLVAGFVKTWVGVFHRGFVSPCTCLEAHDS